MIGSPWCFHSETEPCFLNWLQTCTFGLKGSSGRMVVTLNICELERVLHTYVQTGCAMCDIFRQNIEAKQNLNGSTFHAPSST